MPFCRLVGVFEPAKIDLILQVLILGNSDLEFELQQRVAELILDLQSLAHYGVPEYALAEDCVEEVEVQELDGFLHLNDSYDVVLRTR